MHNLIHQQLLHQSGQLTASQGIADESSASILMELRHSPEPETGLESAPSTPPQNNLEDAQCSLSNCLLCTRGVPGLLIRSPTWASIMRVVFYCLQQDNTSKQFFNLKTDVYGFMTTHVCIQRAHHHNNTSQTTLIADRKWCFFISCKILVNQTVVRSSSNALTV